MNIEEQIVCRLKEARLRLMAQHPELQSVRAGVVVADDNRSMDWHVTGDRKFGWGGTLDDAIRSLEATLKDYDPVADLREQAKERGYELVPITDDKEDAFDKEANDAITRDSVEAVNA